MEKTISHTFRIDITKRQLHLRASRALNMCVDAFACSVLSPSQAADRPTIISELRRHAQEAEEGAVAKESQVKSRLEQRRRTVEQVLNKCRGKGVERFM
jgi:hypothetical protein